MKITNVTRCPSAAVSCRFILLAALLLIPTLLSPSSGRCDDKKTPTPVLKGQAAEDLVRLKREVDALEMLYHLEPTKAQLPALLKIAERTAAKPSATKEASASPEYLKTLQDLRNALVHDDEEQIGTLFQKLAEIEDAQPTEIAEAFDLTPAAIKEAPSVLKLLTPAQVVSLLAAMDNEVPDPVERILFTLSEGEELDAEDWKSLRDETAQEVTWLMHGFNNNAETAKTTKAVSDLLDRGHRLKGDALKKELDSIEQAARKLTGGVSPIVVLQHYMERELAELLSNPQIVTVLKARLEQMKK